MLDYWCLLFVGSTSDVYTFAATLLVNCQMAICNTLQEEERKALVGQSRCFADLYLRCTRIPEMMSLGGCESDVVDINLNEIDDKEFDIPPIDQQPTLESILSLPDDEQSLIDSEVSFAAEFPLPGHAPFVHPVGLCISNSIILSQNADLIQKNWPD